MGTEQRSVFNVTQARCGPDIEAEAKRLFGVIDQWGNLPIVLIPERRHGIKLFITVPTGAACIVQRDGVNLGEVAFVVTKQACTFNYRVTDSPTRDNVMISVDLTLVFNIQQPTTFVYKIGAMHFNDMLKAVAEEATRGMVRSIDHVNVYELRSSAAEQLLAVLNRTFKEFGVLFVNATVTNVQLPPDLSECLENASKIDSQLQEQIRSQEYNLKMLHDKADLELKKIMLKNERLDADLLARKDRLVIEAEAKVLEQQKLAERAILQANQVAETQKVKARAALRDDQTKAQLEVERTLQQARLDAKAKIIQAEQEAAEELMRAEAELQCAINAAKTVQLEAEAESSAASELQSQRAHDLKMATLDSLEKLARSGRIVLSGKAGESLVRAVSQGTTAL
eukprot:m51a1_g7530 hypothetical protein (397) ;mRNA; f:38893-40652